MKVMRARHLARTGVSAPTVRLSQHLPGIACGLLLLLALVACERPDPELNLPTPTSAEGPVDSQSGPTFEGNAALFSPPTPEIHASPTRLPALLPAQLPTYVGTPTPNPTRQATTLEADNYLPHSVEFGESLGQIAKLYGSSIEELMAINNLDNADVLAVGQLILVPGSEPIASPSFKLIPDSELVYGPELMSFSVRSTAELFGGLLLTYQEEVEGQTMSGPDIVQLVADRNSVGPRLLLALLEYQAGWVTQSTVDAGLDFPLGHVQEGYEGLYQQLSWAANLVNLGYYGRAEGGLLLFDVGNDNRMAFAGDINDGTAGLQLFFASQPATTYEDWLVDVGPDGFYATYNRMFGNPFAYTFDPIWPSDLTQPDFSLPWTVGETWFFTGGPHGGWASGSAWAALDFAPPQEETGCYLSEYWVVASADGLVTRSSDGAVVLDLDGDGFAGTGWAIHYLHLDSQDRVEAGSFVRVGDRLGHPSCEGGFSNATHVHIARTYNGRWVSADGSVPFNMSNWISQGLGREYDGLLVRGEVVKEACECREEGNAIEAE